MEIYYIRNGSNEAKIYTIDVDMNDEKIEKIIFPKKFILGPGKSKDVKVFMKSPELKKNEYNGYLLIAEAPVKINQENNVQVNVKMKIKASCGI